MSDDLFTFDLFYSISKINKKLTTIDAIDNASILGCQDGTILIIKSPGQGHSTNTSSNSNLSRFNTFKKPIDQLYVIESHRWLLVLCEGQIRVFHLEADGTIRSDHARLLPITGIVSFAVDAYRGSSFLRPSAAIRAQQPTPTLRLVALEKRRRLHILDVVDHEFRLVKSFSVDVPLLSVGIIGPNIVMASAKDIHLHRLDQTLTADKNVASASDKLKLTSLTSHNTPRPLFIRTHNRLCVYIDNNFHLFSADNNREYFSVNTAARVEALGFSYPYIFAITSSTIEVFSSLLQQQITTVPFPAAVLNSIPGRFLAGDQNILLTTETRSGPLFVTVNDAFRIHCADLQSQVLRSLKMDHIPHAISLLNSVEWDDKSKQIALLQRAELVGAASHMSAGKYQDGLNIYFRLGSNPKDVLFAYAGDCLPKDISALGGDLVSIGLSQQTFIRQSSQADANTPLLNYMREVHRLLNDLEINPTRRPLDDIPAKDRGMYRFLVSLPDRTEITRIVDTALLTLLVDMKNSGPLLEMALQRSTCSEVDARNILRQKPHAPHLITLYFYRCQHNKALSLLKNFGTTQVGTQTGVQHTVAYLQRLNPFYATGVTPAEGTSGGPAPLAEPSDDIVGLILEYSIWVLDHDPTLGVDIFANHPHALALGPDRVVAHLQNRKLGMPALQRYLERLVLRATLPASERIDSHAGSGAHAGMGELLSDAGLKTVDLSQLARRSPASLAVAPLDGVAPAPATRDLTFTRGQLVHLHESLIRLYLEGVLGEIRQAAGPAASAQVQEDPRRYATLTPLRLKLLHFLVTSRYYAPEQFLGRFPINALFDARIVLLSRAKLHDEALNIIVQLQDDLASAELYCELHLARGADMPASQSHPQEDLFMILIRKLLAPNLVAGQEQPLTPAETDTRLRFAIHLVEKHGHKMDILQLVSELPADTQLERIAPLLTDLLRSFSTERHAVHLQRALLRASHVQTRAELAAAKSRYIVIDQTRTCIICSKAISRAAFVIQTDGQPVHFFCSSYKPDMATGAAGLPGAVATPPPEPAYSSSPPFVVAPSPGLDSPTFGGQSHYSQPLPQSMPFHQQQPLPQQQPAGVPRPTGQVPPSAAGGGGWSGGFSSGGGGTSSGPGGSNGMMFLR